MIRISCVIGTFGSDDWLDLAHARALQSTHGQGFYDVTVHHERAGTLAQARNAGAAKAEGEGLVFLDADDELAPGYLDAMQPLLTPHGFITWPTSDGKPRGGEAPGGPTGPVLGVPAVEYHYDSRGTRTPAAIPQMGRWPELNECVIGTLVSHALFDQVGGFREWPSLEDWDLWLRCYDAGARLAYVPRAVYRAHVSSGSRNSDQSAYNEIWAEHLARVAS